MNILRVVVALACLSAGCGPAPQDHAETVHRVGAAELVYHIRDFGDKAYRGHRIQVSVPAKSYTISGEYIHWHTGLPRSKPAIVFSCTAPPGPGDGPLLVIGVCRGAEYDGIRKGDRITFTVHVDGCAAGRIAE